MNGTVSVPSRVPACSSAAFSAGSGQRRCPGWTEQVVGSPGQGSELGASRETWGSRRCLPGQSERDALWIPPEPERPAERVQSREETERPRSLRPSSGFSA